MMLASYHPKNNRMVEMFFEFADSDNDNFLRFFLIFPGPLAFCEKAVERVSSEKNILNSPVEWSGFF